MHLHCLKVSYYPERKIENPEMATAAGSEGAGGATAGKDEKLDSTFDEFIKEVYSTVCSSSS